MKKLWEHIKTWNRWRKSSLNNPIHKILVLFGKYSPTFEVEKWSEKFTAAGWINQEDNK